MRRSFAFLVVLLVCTSTFAQEPAPQPAPNPEMFWEALKKGNEHFAAGKLVYDKLTAERKQFAEAQFPPMTILSCSDSRVPPELVFNQSLGSLFVVRSAGNVADDLGIASIEYAIAQGYTSLIVVLSHQGCGAVRESLGSGDPTSPYILALAQRIRTSFVGITTWDGSNKETLKKAIELNARASATSLIAKSKIIRDAASGGVKIIAAYYDFDTGKVTRLE